MKTHSRVFTVGREVMVRNFREGDKWVCGKIDQLGPVSYLVQCNDGSMWCTHIDHMLDKTISQEIDNEPQLSNETLPDGSDLVNDTTFQDSTSELAATDDHSEPTSPDSVTDPTSTETVETTTSRSEVEIACGHWSISLHFLRMTNQNCIYLVTMTGQLKIKMKQTSSENACRV